MTAGFWAQAVNAEIAFCILVFVGWVISHARRP